MPMPLKHLKTITNSPGDCLRKTASEIVLPTRKLSLESTNEIINSLNEIKQQVNTAHLHQRVLLSTLTVPETVNDSSTVTEASSEESTPHVSRESSRAQEYKQIADEMFKPAASPQTVATLPQVVVESPLVNQPPKFQRSNNTSSQLQQSKGNVCFLRSYNTVSSLHHCT